MSDTSNSHSVEIKHRKKTVPEENMEYEGTVDGKEWFGRYKLGHAPVLGVQAKDQEEPLTKSERSAVRETVFNDL